MSTRSGIISTLMIRDEGIGKIDQGEGEERKEKLAEDPVGQRILTFTGEAENSPFMVDFPSKA